MTWFSRNAARAAAVSTFLVAAFAIPASAQRVQDITPLPTTAVAAPAVEPVLSSSATATTMRKDNMNTITISTVVLVLLVILIVLLVR